MSSENATAIECQNVLLRSENESQHLVSSGLRNIIAIAMPDAVVVAHKDRAQDIKVVVSALKAKGVAQAETFLKDHPPELVREPYHRWALSSEAHLCAGGRGIILAKPSSPI